MFYCDKCGNVDCCERTDLPTEPVLCDECYNKELKAMSDEYNKNLLIMEKAAEEVLKTTTDEKGRKWLEDELSAIRKKVIR